MQQNLLNAEFASGEYQNAVEKNMHFLGYKRVKELQDEIEALKK
jgi:hypothetical protein